MDGKSIMSQVHDFENLVYLLRLKGIIVNVNPLTTLWNIKLPSSWLDFTRTL